MEQQFGLILYLMQLSGVVGFIELSMAAEHQAVQAHNFIPDDTSTFLALVYKTQVELSLTVSNFPSNISLALEHAENTADHMDDALYMDDSRDDTDFMKKYNQAMNSRNVTTNALVLANILDQVLIEYGKAFDVDYDPTNMSNMMMMKRSENFNSSLPSHTSNISTQEHMTSNLPIPSKIANYQSSQRLSETAYDFFKSSLLHLLTKNIYNANNEMFESKVEKNLVELKDLVNSNATVPDLMMMVHGQIHPNLQLAYNLGLKQ